MLHSDLPEERAVEALELSDASPPPLDGESHSPSLPLHKEIIAVCSQIHTKHINILCGQNVEFLSVKPGGTHTEH